MTKEPKTQAHTEGLKPCPFCGGKAKMNDDRQHWGDIYCPDCGCHVSVGGLDTVEAILIWNKRTNSHQELVEALRDLVECSPCQNGCEPDDMTCATNKAKQTLTNTEEGE